ncbi:NADP-dependent malic enzyme [Porphyridium purpureum]|uniref:Malic enzyme n=1 Tax=Porphyridium purpureum TaxID=35688 RepID=A0A5J4YME1_PORPP|nr:NADP-dependent malic enzyme [Porphyridium purpureum]|eukprot:POR8486..scf249_10
MAGKKVGYDVLRDPTLNKGVSFSEDERKELKLVGLLPPRTQTLEQQVERQLTLLRRLNSPLDKFVFLQALLARTQRVFFKLMIENIVEVMPVVYTPTVGEACQNWGHILQFPRGLYISYKQKGSILEVLENWPTDDVRVIVVTDGERILGLGDLGCWGMGIPVGKLLLYNGCGGVYPEHTLPVQLDLGCDTKSIRADPLYFGLDMDRVRGAEYDAFIEEFVRAVQKRFGTACLIQFEDFAQANAARLLHKYQMDCCCFNDDIQGTAGVALSGVFGALRLPGVEKDLSKHTLLFYGAGSAGIGIADLIVDDLMEAFGMSREEAKRKCWFLDSKGLIYEGRASLTPEKLKYAHPNPPQIESKDLLSAVKALRPSILIGVSTIPNSFTTEVIQTMCEISERPVIMALSNPTSKAECTAEACYRVSNGKAIFASGSPFDPVTMPDGSVRVPAQANNAYIFPGVGNAIALCGAKHVTNQMFLESAKTLAELITDEDMAVECVCPSLSRVQECSAHISYRVCKMAEKQGLATRPIPKSVEEVQALFYNPAGSQK